ncbi:MAG: hypothetical protein ABMB14_06240 [Myxococcota bacterium]
MVWLLAAVAWAGNVYVNGTYVEPRSLVGVTMSGATVRFDDQGNIRIDAPGYKISVATPSPVAQPAPAPPPAPVVAYGRWWLFAEDKGSAGHLVDVWINGTLAQTFRSGQGDKLVEISKWLRPGANTVIVKSTSTGASGGSLTLFAGVGGSDKGFFDMPTPQIEYGLGPTRSGVAERTYTLTVDR